MKWKIVVFSIFFTLIFLADIFVKNVLIPEVSTGLALEQFENPSVQTDTMLRIFNPTSVVNFMYIICFTMGMLFLLSEVKNIFDMKEDK